MKRIKKKRKIKKIFWILLAIIIALVTSVVVFIILKKDNNTETPVNKPVEIVDKMENYDYHLDENATEYYKTLYNELKEVLNSEEINEEEYAKTVSKLFVADLFTLDNKLTSSDIGGLQFVYTDFKEDFINIAKTTLYSNVESNIYDDRNQELPIVSDVQIDNIETSSFNYQNNKHDSYKVTVSITYQKDLGYPSKYKLTLIKNDKYLQVVASE
ncbi:MAG: hypothetical protein IJZ46_01505 [Bacilli bacterium]|nr:hypothetical protein [Bacilli bacterium]